MLERFDLDVGSGRREGQAYLTLEPDIDAKKTIIDFNLNQKGVRTMNRLRVMI